MMQGFTFSIWDTLTYTFIFITHTQITSWCKRMQNYDLLTYNKTHGQRQKRPNNRFFVIVELAGIRPFHIHNLENYPVHLQWLNKFSKDKHSLLLKHPYYGRPNLCVLNITHILNDPYLWQAS